MTFKFVELYGSASLQSAAKPGRRHFGVPAGGPFDEEAHDLANALAGNPPGSSALELTLVSGRVEMLEAGRLAWVGAGAFNACRLFQTGSVLQLSAPLIGCRSHMASTGGLSEVEPRVFVSHNNSEVQSAELALRLGDPTLRFVRSPRHSFLDWERFVDTGFRVGLNSNRTGVRLECDLPFAHEREIRSEPMNSGVIQLPPSGHPIVLGPDSPTIGGYPRLGYVIGTDMSRLAQRKPGDVVKFAEVSLEEAREINASARKQLAQKCVLLRANAVSGS